MRDGYRKIFWGLFFATFNIKIGIITILPGFVAWIIVATGLSELDKETKDEDFSRPYTLCAALVIVAILGDLISFLGISVFEIPILLSYYPLLALAIELALFHNLLNTSIQNFQALGWVDLVEKYLAKNRVYIILMWMAMAGIILELIIVNELALFLVVGLGLIARLYLLYVISSIRKDYYEVENNMEGNG